MATKTTIEVPVEEQITTTDFVEETSNQASEVEAAGEIARLSKEEVLALVEARKDELEVLVTLGAGDIENYAQAITQILKS